MQTPPPQIRCLAVDDEPIALAKLREYIRKIPWLELAGCCENAFEAATKLAESAIDAIFLDINMPGLNGLDFISTLDCAPAVIFTTAYAEYAAESFKVQPVDYLLKPYDFVSFQRAATRLLRRCVSVGEDESVPLRGDDRRLFVKVDYRYVGIDPEDILYIKGMSEYVRIVLPGRQPLTVLLSMREALAKLPSNFLQVHRSYIVNMNRVSEISRQHITMTDGEKIAVSDNYRAPFAAWVRVHSLERSKPGKG